MTQKTEPPRMRWRWLVVVLILVTTVAGSWAQDEELEVRRRGRVLHSLSLEELQKLVPPQRISLPTDAPGAHKGTYIGFPMRSLLKALYGDVYKRELDVVFACADGYISSAPAEDFRLYDAYLVFQTADKSPFKGEAELGPFCLIWDLARRPDRKSQAVWPYQVVALDIAPFKERFPKVIPPARSRPEVMRGFITFRHACLGCHRFNGQGGDRALDLNWPISVTEYMSETYIKAIIDDPKKVRGNSAMHGLIPDFPNRRQAIDDLVAYMKAMAAGKKKLDPRN